MLFQSKLNELPQEVSLAYKFCSTIHMQYFEVSILLFFKYQSIPVANSENKSIAFFQKCKVNELTQKDSLASTFFLTFQILNAFSNNKEVFIFVVFKCQFLCQIFLAEVLLSSKSAKMSFFRSPSSFWNKIDKKIKPKSLPWHSQFFESWKPLNSNRVLERRDTCHQSTLVEVVNNHAISKKIEWFSSGS